MARENQALFAFNRGIVSRQALARVDLERLRLSSEEQTNWMPRALGSMMLRPGMEFLDSTRNDAKAYFVPFVFEIDDTALLEFTAEAMRIWIDDEVLTRASHGSTITNGDFTSSLTGWTDVDEGGSANSAAVTGNFMGLTGDGANEARRVQAVTIAVADQVTEHALRVVVESGPVNLKVGTTSGGDEIVPETSLREGVHSIAFTPGVGVGTIHIQLGSRAQFRNLVAECDFEAAGEQVFETPFLEANLNRIRTTQSRDVIFIACDGFQQRRIERRARTSWSLVLYQTSDGPFRNENTSQVTITPSNFNGDITLTASSQLFRSGHVGALFRLTSSGQQVSRNCSAENQFTTPGVRVNGVGDDRIFRAAVSAGTSSTVTVQRAVGADEDSLYSDVQTVAAGGSVSIDDGLDNQIIFYRIGVKTGDFVDAAIVSLTYARGSIDGVVRISAVASATSASARVLSSLGGVVATPLWAEGEWSTFRGFPTATHLFDGRLWWAGRGRLWGSVSDAFEAFNDLIEGDSRPISRTISDGPSDVATWISEASRMTLGTTGGAFEARSSSLDEPLTAAATALKRFNTAGAANVDAARLDETLIFVQRGGREWLEVSAETLSDLRQRASRLTAIVPELGEPGFERLAVQHQPDTRVHGVRSDGKVVVLITDPAEEVRCFIVIETDGVVEDVVVLPGDEEDRVYYVVRRTINGVTKRYLEKWAKESDARGAAITKLSDAFKLFEFGSGVGGVSGLDHLIGETVTVWADGTPRDDAVVNASGAIAISGAEARQIVVGLPYEARFKSVKLAFAARKGTALTMPKRVNALGLVLIDTHHQGLRYGPDFDSLTGLPTTIGHKPIEAGTVLSELDFDAEPIFGEWDTDSRICLLAASPKPATVVGAVIDIETTDR